MTISKKMTIALRLVAIFGFIPFICLQLGSFTQNRAFAVEPAAPASTSFDSSPVAVNNPGVPQVINTDNKTEVQQAANYAFISIGLIGLFAIIPITFYVLYKKRKETAKYL